MLISVGNFSLLALDYFVWQAHLLHLRLVERLDDFIAEGLDTIQSLGYVGYSEADMTESHARRGVVVPVCVWCRCVSRDVVEL